MASSTKTDAVSNMDISTTTDTITIITTTAAATATTTDTGSPSLTHTGINSMDEDRVTDTSESPPSSMDESMDDVISKGCGVFGPVVNDHVTDPKLQYINPSSDEFDGLVLSLKRQMEDGQGEVIMELGVGGGCSNNGLSKEDMDSSVATLQSIAAACGADMTLLRQRVAEGGLLADCLIRKKVDENDFLEVRVAVVGNVDAGKSTLLGVLTHGELDNGRGYSRQKLFRHKHEVESGRTSSVGSDILGFDNEGRVVNTMDGHGGLDWAHICQASSKVLTFIDLAGHERYLKTTIFGMTGHAPDFCMLMIGSNAGIVGMTKEHLGLALALNVPVFVVVTKIDMCPPNVLQETMKLLNRILKSPGCRKIPMIVQSHDDVITCATNFTSARICPIFQVSNVTGFNLDLLKSFLSLLSARMQSHEEKPAEFQIDETYSVPVCPFILDIQLYSVLCIT
jgi:GTPase